MQQWDGLSHVLLLLNLFIVSSLLDCPRSSCVLLRIHFEVTEQQLAGCLLAMYNESELGKGNTGN